MKKPSVLSRSDILSISISFIFLSVVFGIGLFTRNPDRSKWIKAVGTVEYRTWGNTGARMFSYTVNGEQINDAYGYKGILGECVGDVYEILYDPKNFKHIYVLNDKPLFLEGENVGETVGTIMDNHKVYVEKEYKEITPGFSYLVNGREYERAQVIHVPLNTPLNVTKGMRFRVRYLIAAPQRSILDFNKGEIR